MYGTSRDEGGSKNEFGDPDILSVSTVLVLIIGDTGDIISRILVLRYA